MRLEHISEIDWIADFAGKAKCANCGAPVSHYTCNGDLIAKRPEAATWDWWAACDNAECPNHHGEGIFQEWPDWQQPS